MSPPASAAALSPSRGVSLGARRRSGPLRPGSRCTGAAATAATAGGGGGAAGGAPSSASSSSSAAAAAAAGGRQDDERDLSIHPPGDEELRWFDGFRLPFGTEGRNQLLRRLRQLYHSDAAYWGQQLEQHKIAFSRVPFATVSELWKIAHVMGCFGFALHLSRKYAGGAAARAVAQQQQQQQQQVAAATAAAAAAAATPQLPQNHPTGRAL